MNCICKERMPTVQKFTTKLSYIGFNRTLLSQCHMLDDQSKGYLRNIVFKRPTKA